MIRWRAVEKLSVQKCRSEDSIQQHTEEEQNTREFQKTRGARCGQL
jgi:hypothetical protein